MELVLFLCVFGFVVGVSLTLFIFYWLLPWLERRVDGDGCGACRFRGNSHCWHPVWAEEMDDMVSEGRNLGDERGIPYWCPGKEVSR